MNEGVNDPSLAHDQNFVEAAAVLLVAPVKMYKLSLIHWRSLSTCHLFQDISMYISTISAVLTVLTNKMY